MCLLEHRGARRHSKGEAVEVTPLQRRWLQHFSDDALGVINVDIDGPRVLGRGWGTVNWSCLRRGWLVLIEIEGFHRMFGLTVAGAQALKEADAE